MQFPKTDDELELYIKLQTVVKLHETRDLKVGAYMTPKDFHEQQYQKAKAEYLKLANA